MKFDTPATENPIDQGRVVGKPVDRIDGPLKTTGTAPYAYERHDVAKGQAYGWIVGAPVAKGKIDSIDLAAAKAAPGVIAIVTAENAGKLGQAERNTAPLLAGPEIAHYHQAVALVIAETFEQVRTAANLVKVVVSAKLGNYDLAKQKNDAPMAEAVMGDAPASEVGEFETAYEAAPVKLDETFHTAHESHSMMEPHATVAAWNGDQLTLWTSNQMIAWCVGDMAKTLGIPEKSIHVMSPYIGGGFGGKLFLRADALLAALGARIAKRPVKVTLARAMIPNNTTHRSATVQRIRLACERDGKIRAIGHEVWSGDQPKGQPEAAAMQTRALYAGSNRMTAHRLAVLDLPEANAMRAPGEAPGLAALEIAVDEMAEKLGIDPVEFRVINDTKVVPDVPKKPGDSGGNPSEGPPFSQRKLVQCLREGAERFGWEKRSPKPGGNREGNWLIGMGVAAAFRNNILTPSAARVRLDREGVVTVETDMTDIGTGSYTILAQTAAEMTGVPLEQVRVKLGDSTFPVSCGSGGQWGANNSTSGVYAACVKLRAMIAEQAGFDEEGLAFADGQVRSGDKAVALGTLAEKGELVAEDKIEYGDLDKKYQQSTFGAHFVEVAVDAYTGETRVRRMLAMCAAGRILNPMTARSQVIGAMTMGVGAALMEELAVDVRHGLFINHDLAGYEIPVHADIPHQDVVFLDETDPISSPMKAKGVGELGICGVAAAIANAIHNATGVRLRSYPLKLEKLLDGLPEIG